MGLATLLCPKKEPHGKHEWKASDGFEYVCPGVVDNFEDSLIYVEHQMDRLESNNVTINGDMPESFFKRFEQHGIIVTRQPIGYIRFEKIQRKGGGTKE